MPAIRGSILKLAPPEEPPPTQTIIRFQEVEQRRIARNEAFRLLKQVAADYRPGWGGRAAAELP
jgi:hypothetical protein